MSEIDDIDGEDGGVPATGGGAEAAATIGAGYCLACDAVVAGAFCGNCGQKHDDMRRSSFLLIRDFLRDTFGFDSRMWRTLGLMAIAPGVVPNQYTHGKRSRFTPPVRLFIVVSFLFFLTIALTNTLFIAMEVRPLTAEEIEAGRAEMVKAGVDVSDEDRPECNFNTSLRFFVKEKEIDNPNELIDKCFDDVGDKVREEINESDRIEVGREMTAEEERALVVEKIERGFAGARWALENPRGFNDAFNTWLPRVLFLMTPVLALILTVFIRGRDALIFDHLVLSFYTHAAGFAIVAITLLAAQAGAPAMGMAAFLAVALYYLLALKRAYGRGWIKTVWTTFMSGMIYLFILMLIVVGITSNIIWRAAG